MEFTYQQPTEIRFGQGRLDELGEVAAALGRRALLVTVPVFEALRSPLERARASLRQAGLSVAHYDGVVANPTTESVDAGAAAARAAHAEVIIGLGGGSSMDTAKAIAVGATHPGSAWDYLFFKKQPSAATLPVVAVTTTSGTGSHVTQVAVMTETRTRTKSAIYHPRVFPRVAIVDPDLVVSAPPHVTASTGFDVLAHAFESYIHVRGNPYADVLAVEALRLVRRWLPCAVREGGDPEARRAMAWADTLAGLCIATAGVTLPHGMGMTIGGFAPHVMHGEALAVVYPEFMRFTWASAIARFAVLGRILDPSLAGADDRQAAEGSCAALDAFLGEIGMWLSFEQLGVERGLLGAIADQSRVLPDYQNNPRIAGREEIFAMLEASYRR
ncbi:MAG TPA: iron-containing alcohol dehydrogenase [Anaeromyxobacter sp.]|nr:iron-containing alcohol dehydrogenase [Anaeromyxobacter sp.]